MVSAGVMPRDRRCAHVNTSSESAIRSARLPTSSEPCSASSPIGARVPDRERAHRLVARHALLGLPARIGALARPARHRGVEAVEGVGVLHREVGAARDVGARCPAPSARRRRRRAARARGARRPIACRRCSGWAACSAPRPGARSAGCRRARGSGRARRAAVVAGRRRPHLLEHVEHQRVGAIADGVHPDVEAAGARLAGEPLHLLGGHQHEPGVGGVVAVGRVQRGAARAERAVEPELDRAHHEPAVAHRLGRAALAVLGPTPSCRESAAKTRNGKRPRSMSRRVGRDRGQVEPRLVRTGEPLGEALGDGVTHRRSKRSSDGGGTRRADEVLGEVDQDPGGLAALVLRDAPARRVRGVARDAGARRAPRRWPTSHGRPRG